MLGRLEDHPRWRNEQSELLRVRVRPKCFSLCAGFEDLTRIDSNEGLVRTGVDDFNIGASLLAGRELDDQLAKNDLCARAAQRGKNGCSHERYTSQRAKTVHRQI